MSTLTLIDSEAVVRQWARAESHINAVVGDRVFFATPQPFEKTPPNVWITLFLVSETHLDDDLGLQRALIQFDCWSPKTKALAASAALAVQTAGQQLVTRPVTVGSTVIVVGSVSQRRWLPDPTTNSPRYVVDVSFVLRGT